MPGCEYCAFLTSIRESPFDVSVELPVLALVSLLRSCITGFIRMILFLLESGNKLLKTVDS